ncbi:MAG TPA: hypothetical protein VGF71_06445 [Caulobacteraceae bacterium]|jgi:hypothetical protein
MARARPTDHARPHGDDIDGKPRLATMFDFGSWKSEVASRKNDDGTTSFVTIDPTNAGFNVVVTTNDGKRGLDIRDGQQVYHYTEG